MKKKMLALMVTMAMTVSLLTACGSAKEEQPAETKAEETEAQAEEEALTEESSEAAEEASGEQEVQDEASAAKPLEGENLIFGINATFAPFEYVDGSDENGNEVLAGLDIDLIDKLSEMLGFTYEFNDMEFNGLIGSISSGRCDVIVSGISINEERDEVVDASAPYFIPRIAILSYGDNEYKDLDSLDGHSVAVSFGTVYANIANDHGGIEVKELDSTAIAFQEFSNKNVDACIFDANQAQSFINDNPELGLVRNILPDEIADKYEVKGYCILVPEGETEMLSYFDDALAELKENGFMDELIVKWCGEDYLD